VSDGLADLQDELNRIVDRLHARGGELRAIK
jgi:hypothetical protein